jgi:hypothetical protein
VLVYLAEGLSDVAGRGLHVEHEELDMTIERVPLDEAVQRVFDGAIRNSAAVVGLLAAAQHRAAGTTLRPSTRASGRRRSAEIGDLGACAACRARHRRSRRGERPVAARPRSRRVSRRRPGSTSRPARTR